MYLSKDGRINLVKNTIKFTNLFLSLFPIPASVAICIEKLYCNVLCSGLGYNFKFHLVKWDKVCFSISFGGLGIRNLRIVNQALLGKWLWRYNMESEVLWKCPRIKLVLRDGSRIKVRYDLWTYGVEITTLMKISGDLVQAY